MADLVTAGQKVKLRADAQAAQIFAIIDAPSTVYSCRVNQTFTTHDMVAQFTFDGGTGTYTDVLPDMTVLVGSAAGLSDLGMCRVRKAWGVATAYIGEGSEIDWDDDLYITVIDDFGIWARHIRPVAGVFYADYDVAYSDQHTTRDPLITLGGDRVVWLTGATVAVTFAIENQLGDVTTWATTATGGVVTDETTTAPTVTFDTAGRYRVTVTGTQSTASFARHVYVHVLGAAYQPLTDFTLNSVDSDSGTVANITAYDDVDAVGDMVRVIIFERAYYQGTEGSIGVVTGMENIILSGFIAGESINYNPDVNSVSFDVENAFYWLDRLAQYPSGIEDTTGTASAWTNINGLTADKAVWHLAHWRSTLSRMMDVILSGDTRQSPKLAEGTGSLGGQLRSSAASILAEIAVDRYGRMHVQIPHNLVPEADRVTPTVMTLTDADMQAGIQMTRNTSGQTAQVDLSGVVYSGGSGAALFSLSPGHVFNRFGNVVKIERIALTNQAQANELAGLKAGRDNNVTPEITITLAGINRAFDTAPQGLAALTISSAHSPRGIGFSGNAVARRINYQHDPLTGRLVTQITFEPETVAAPSTDGDPPSDAGYPPFSPFPPLPPMPELPPDLPEPPIDPDVNFSLAIVYVLTDLNRILACGNFNDTGNQVWVDITPDGGVTWSTLAAYGTLQVDWNTGSLYANDLETVYHCYPYKVGDTYYFNKMYARYLANNFAIPGVPINNTFKGVAAVNPITGEFFALGNNPLEGSTKRYAIVGDVYSTPSVYGSISTGTLLGTNSIGNGILLHGTNSGFIRSINAGATWTTKNLTGDEIQNLRPDPVGAVIYYHSTLGISNDSGRELGKSTDLGDTGSLITGGSSFEMKINTGISSNPDTSIMMGAANDTGTTHSVSKSTDGGANWALVSGALKIVGSGKNAWCGYDESGNDVFMFVQRTGAAGTYLSHFEITNDAGATWTSNTEIQAFLQQPEVIEDIAIVLGGAQ